MVTIKIPNDRIVIACRKWKAAALLEVDERMEGMITWQMKRSLVNPFPAKTRKIARNRAEKEHEYYLSQLRDVSHIDRLYKMASENSDEKMIIDEKSFANIGKYL